jgi:hypothetical protein
VRLKEKRMSAEYDAFKKTVSVAMLTNASWFRSAREMEVVWYIIPCGATVRSYRFQREIGWTDGPSLTLEDYNSEDVLAGKVLELVGEKKITGIGVVVYLADGFSLMEVDPGMQGAEKVPMLRELLRGCPQDAIAERIDEGAVYRLLTDARNVAKVVKLSESQNRIWETVARTVHERGVNIPVKVALNSAAVSAIAGFFMNLDETVQVDDGPPVPFKLVAAFLFTGFTALVAINAAREFLQIRSLPHGTRACPDGFGSDVLAAYKLLADDKGAQTTVIAMVQCSDASPACLVNAFESHVTGLGQAPDTYNVISTDEDAAQELLLKEAGRFGLSSPFAASGINKARWELLTQHPETRFETHGNVAVALRCSALEDFSSNTERDRPTQMDVVAYYGLKAGGMCSYAALLCYVVFSAVNLVGGIQTPAWKLPYRLVDEAKAKEARLLADRADYRRWTNVFQPRSQAWFIMEMLLELLPEGKNVVVSSADAHLTLLGQGGTGSKLGFERELKVTGFATEEGALQLSRFNNRETVAKELAIVGDKLKLSFAENDHRRWSVQYRTERNGSYVEDASAHTERTSAYPYNFALTLTFTATAEDQDLALEKGHTHAGN